MRSGGELLPDMNKLYSSFLDQELCNQERVTTAAKSITTICVIVVSVAVSATIKQRDTAVNRTYWVHGFWRFFVAEGCQMVSDFSWLLIGEAR